MADCEFADVYRSLSVPAGADRSGMSRRRFLQGMLVTAGATAVLPSWMVDMAAAATPVGANEGILVVIMMGGGNDGLDMVRPLSTAAGHGFYVDQRPTLSTAGSIALDADHGLHANLTYTKTLWDQGKVAIVRGIGNTEVQDLSHFSSMATWMRGSAGTGPPTSGWLGRYLDGLDRDPLRAVHVGASVPLHVVGTATKAVGLPRDLGSAFGVDRSDPINARLYDAAKAFAAAPTGLGAVADSFASNISETVDLATTIAPAYSTDPPADELGQSMQILASLINLDLGVRVLSCGYGDFDNHEWERDKHDTDMAQLDAALATFYATLDPAFAKRVTVMTFSEFGRRVPENASQGTDHGEASLSMVIGDNVNGGYQGTMPSLDPLSQHWGDLVPTTDFRQLYAGIIQDWLGGDASQIVGGSYPASKLDLFKAGPGT